MTAEQIAEWTDANRIARSIRDEEEAERRNHKRTCRFEVVHTDAGWHGRFVAANNRAVWTTEVYTRKATALEAVKLLDTEAAADAALPEFIWQVDETTAQEDVLR